MKTDELRRELHDAALQIEPFEGDVGRVHGRVRARRVALAGAMVVALAIPAVVVATRGDDDDAVTAGAPKEIAAVELESPDALIVVGSRDDLPRMQSELESLDRVVAYAVLDAGVATLAAPWKGGEMPLGCNDDGGFIVDLVHPSDLPEIEALVGSEGAVHDWRAVTAASGNDQAVGRRAVIDRVLGKGRWSSAEMEAFMQVDATAQQIAAVRAVLDADPDVAKYEYLDKQGAYAEFQRIFRDNPALIESTTADALPASFRVTPAEGVDVEALEGRLGLPGVEDVLTPADTLPCE